MKMEKSEEFKTKNSYKLDAFPLSGVVDVSNLDNGKNLYVVKFIDKKEVTGSLSENKLFEKQMIVSKQTVEKICETPRDFQSIITKDDSNVYFVNKEFIYYYSNYGEMYNLNEISGVKSNQMSEFINNKCFDDIKNKDDELIQFVKNKNDLRIWKTSDGELHAPPMILDYIAAKLDNETYHLDLLIEHLMKRDDVSFLTEEGRWSTAKKQILSCPMTGEEKGVENIISDIPGYNSTEDCNESITLIYKPKSEDVRKIMDWEMDKHDKTSRIWNVENYIVRDLLGCDRFSKNPVIVPESVVPKRKFKR
jgi:phage pi2 protein 07